MVVKHVCMYVCECMLIRMYVNLWQQICAQFLLRLGERMYVCLFVYVCMYAYAYVFQAAAG